MIDPDIVEELKKAYGPLLSPFWAAHYHAEPLPG